jgi:hypothetical protein
MIKNNSNWIKLNDWEKVHFPEVCPFSGLKATERKEYWVFNSSIFWKIMWVLRLSQYIEIYVPFSKEALIEMKKQRRKAILKGIFIGFIFAISGLIIGVYISVEASTKQLQMLGTMIGGCSFVFSLILCPIILDIRLQKSSSPIEFKKKDKQLWVKIRNEGYRKSFLILNDFMLIPNNGTKDDEILDRAII